MYAWLLFVILTLGLGLTPTAHATYSVALTSEGLPSRTLKPGDRFDLDVELASDGVDRHDSSVLHLIFSCSGLVLHSYSWGSPFQTSGPDDASVPARSALPATISPTTAAGTALPADTADLWFSNLTTSSPAFGVGRVLRLSLSIPTNYIGPDTINIRVAEATLARGVRTIPTTTVPFVLRIEPATGTAPPALVVLGRSSQFTLSWDKAIVGAYVESTDDLAATNWTRVTTPPTSEGDRTVLKPEPPAGGAPRFYRLRFP